MLWPSNAAVFYTAVVETDMEDGAAIEGQLASAGFINIHSSLGVGSQEQKTCITLMCFLLNVLWKTLHTVQN